MSTFLKPIVLGLGLMAGVAIGAHAQTAQMGPSPGPSVASLPLEGPRANSATHIPAPSQQAVAPSGRYPGPGPGEWTIKDPPHFDKPAGYDADARMHPYNPGIGPKTN